MTASINNYSLNAPLPWIFPTAASMEYQPVLSQYPYESVIVASNRLPVLNSRIFSLLKEFEQLPYNWDEDNAAKPETNALIAANYISLVLEKTGQKIFHTAPGPNGEIMIDLRNDMNNRSIEILFYSNRSVYVTFSPNEPSKQGNFEIDLMPELLEWLNSSMNA